jgi:hypothetical protein
MFIVVSMWGKRDESGDRIEETIWDQYLLHDSYREAKEHYESLLKEPLDSCGCRLCKGRTVTELTDMIDKDYEMLSASICVPIESTEPHYVDGEMNKVIMGIIERCSICENPIDWDLPDDYSWRFGNNAWPVNDGRCCKTCDDTVVIPARLEMHFANRRKTTEKETEGCK